MRYASLAKLICSLGICVLCVGANAAAIVVAPGGSPAGGYLPLSLFGIAPMSGIGDDTITNQITSTFEYAGQTWNSLGIGSNGFVIVGGSSSTVAPFVNTNLPNAAAPTNMLAPFWTDLNPAGGGGAGDIRIGNLTDGSNTWIVVDWAGVKDFGDATVNSFEVWIGITGDANPGEDITFAYGAVGSGSNGHVTVGAQDLTGIVGDAYYFDGAGTLPVQGTQLRVTTSGFPVPEPSPLALLGLAIAGMGFARQRKLN